jgi:hypothetical protein
MHATPKAPAAPRRIVRRNILSLPVEVLGFAINI